MIPVGDSAPVRRTAWVNTTIIVVSIVAFLFELLLGPGVDLFVRRWGVTPLFVTAALSGDPQVPRSVLLTLVTAISLHGGWLHLGSNMLFLWVFGDNVEDRFGHIRYLLFYLICGAGANLVQVLVVPESTVPLIGASGAIAAVLGAYLVMFPRSTITVLVPVFFFPLLLPVPAFLMLGVWIITQFANGLAAITSSASMSGGIGWWAHIGGFLLGALVTPVMPKARRREQVYRPLTIAGPRDIRRTHPRGAAIVRGVTFLGDVINLLLTLRLVFVVFDAPQFGLVGAVVRLVYALSWPLVEPFSQYLPYLVVGGRTIELYTILAFVVYYLLIAMVAWVLAFVLGQRRRASY